jgi:hypothetical protein
VPGAGDQKPRRGGNRKLESRRLHLLVQHVDHQRRLAAGGDGAEELLKLCQRLRRADDLHGHVHDAAADQAVVPAIVVIEAKGEEAALVVSVHQALGAEAHFGFDASAAERADGFAVLPGRAWRAPILRRAAARADDRAERDASRRERTRAAICGSTR